MEAFFILYILHTLAKIHLLLLKYIYYILSALFIFSCSKTKNSNEIQNIDSLDSLSIYLANTQNENKPRENRIISSNKAFNLLKSQKNTSYSRDQLYNIAKFNYESKLDFQFKNTVFILIESSKKEKDLKLLSKSYNLLGNHYINIVFT